MKLKLITMLLAASFAFSGCVFNEKDWDDTENTDAEEQMHKEQAAGLILDLLFPGRDESSGQTNVKAVQSSRLTNLILEGAEISPAFDSETTGYTAAAPAGALQVKITAVPADSSAKIRLNGELILPSRTYTIPLADAETVIMIEVENGSKTGYVVLVKR